MPKYFVYSGGRYCEVNMRTGQVAGFRKRGKFYILRGDMLLPASQAVVQREVRARARADRARLAQRRLEQEGGCVAYPSPAPAMAA